MKKLAVLLCLLFALPVFAVSVCAAPPAFSLTVPDYYEAVSENEWHTDSFMINGEATEVTITVTFQDTALSHDVAFSQSNCSAIERDIRRIAGFDCFGLAPKVDTTEKHYKTIVTSYLVRQSDRQWNIVEYNFYSADSRCTVRFVASHTLFSFVVSDTMIDTLSFEAPFYSEPVVPADTTDGLENGEEVAQEVEENKNENSESVAFKVVFAVISVLLTGLVVFLVGVAVYWRFDHGKWNKDAQPDANAVIVDVSSKTKSLGKNDTKYITAVVFSDGYVFKTSKTKREEKFFTYTISVDAELRQQIVGKAIQAHNQAVEKWRNAQ